LNFKLIFGFDELLQAGWADFIASHPDGTVFQSPKMYELFSATKQMKPVVVGLADAGNGALKGILSGVIIREMNGPAGYFSSRTVIYGGPLLDPGLADKGQILHLLLRELIREVKSRSIFIQFRNFNDQKDHREIFHESRFKLRDRLNLIVDTSSAEIVKKNMSASRIRQIKKGLELGAVYRAPKNTEEVRAFYEILKDLYRFKVKKPLPDWDFFEHFYRLTEENRLGIIRLVEYRDQIIGGILSPVTPGKTIYEWYVCGLDHEYREVHPSVLATWAAIEYAIKNNIPRFDFMGVGLPDRKYGVRDFKARFGGKMVNYGRFARINNRTVYIVSEIGYNLLVWLKKI